MRKIIIPSTIFITLLMFVFVFEAKAQTDSVTATVTVSNISISVSDGSASYGTLSTSSTQDTTTSGLDDSQTATNDGNMTEDFNVSGQNSADWTLAATAGSEQYFHNFCTSDCDGSPTWTALTTSYQTLATGIASSSDQVFDLQIGTPSSTVNFTQQSVDITVQAVEN